MISAPSVSIVIVSYNTRDLVLKCLESIRRNGGASVLETLVVDNASADGTVEALRRDFPDVVRIENPGNYGFARAANQGAREAKGRWVLLLNSDAYFKTCILDAMVETAESGGRTAALGCRVVHENGRHQPSAGTFPNLRLDFSDLFLSPLSFLPGFLRGNCVLTEDFSSVRRVDWVSGSCLLLRRSVLEEEGWLDEQFFLGEEDVDLAFRLSRKKWDFIYFPGVSVVHVGGESRKKNPKSFYYFLLGRFLFYKKHRGASYAALYRALVRFSMRVRCLLASGEKKESAEKILKETGTW